MTFLEIARRWTILILAETLKTSVSAIEAVLPVQPRWLAQIALLASQMRAAADRDTFVWDEDDDEVDGAPETAGLPSMEVILASHTCLRQGLSDIVARGLALDEDLLERMRTDWSSESVVSYLSTAEKNLRDSVNLTLDQAADSMGLSVVAMTALAGCKPAAKPEIVPLQRAGSVR